MGTCSYSLMTFQEVNKMTEEQIAFYNKLIELTGEQVADAFLNWHGTQLLTKDFMQNVCEEYLGEDE